jgi:hypothetical protein
MWSTLYDLSLENYYALWSAAVSEIPMFVASHHLLALIFVHKDIEF